MAASQTLAAAAYSVKNIITHGLGGIKLRLVTITLNATYGTPGYIVTATGCKLTKILWMSGGALGIYSASISYSGANAIMQMIVGAAGVNAEAADELSGLNGVVGKFLVIGY